MAKTIISRLKTGDLPLDFNWNTEFHPEVPLIHKIPAEPTAEQILKTALVSEDLRDGLHGISEYPSVPDMLDYIDSLVSLGINRITVGIYPGEKNRIDTSIKKILSVMAKKYPHISPIVLCLATEASLQWTGECKKNNSKLEVLVFMGTAPSRLLVEEWTEDSVLAKLSWAIKEARKRYSIEVIGGTEHTTQTPPDFLKKIIQTMVKSGVKNFCIADTIGTARPVGTYRIVTFVKNYLKHIDADNVLIEWHGHRDMGNDIGNALTAIAAGARLVHTVARGIGERSGNTPLETLLLNFYAILQESQKDISWKMENLTQVLSLYSKITHVSSPSHGSLGQRAHTTSLGIHTAAMLKAEKLAREARDIGENKLADKLEQMSRKIYTAVDPQVIGGQHTIHVGPWSGTSTVRIAFLNLGGDPNNLSDETVGTVLNTAKKLGRELTVKELKKLLF